MSVLLSSIFLTWLTHVKILIFINMKEIKDLGLVNVGVTIPDIPLRLSSLLSSDPVASDAARLPLDAPR
jgi:hypothetical protein